MTAKHIRLLKVICFLFVNVIFLARPESIWAGNDFSTIFNSTYEVSLDAVTKVTHKISLTNVKPNIFASEYSISIGGTNISNIKAFDSGGEIKTISTRKENSTDILVNLEANPIVGTGKTKNFSIQYLNLDIAAKIGRVLELNIPRISNSNEFEAYEIVLVVPSEYGEPNSIVPEPASMIENNKNRIVKFSKSNISSGITAVFGSSQVFSVELKYFLENNGSMEKEMTVALIPDTAMQTVSYRKIEPRPVNIEADADGNWLAFYNIGPGQNVEINVGADVELLMKQRKYIPQSRPESYLSKDEYWQTDDEKIVNIADSLDTPKEIYDFVVDKLNYDYSKIEIGSERKGAMAALIKPEESLCTEFTDLFVALARAAGIPAREHNGFAYTLNPDLRPLSLSKDILHSWPEYWDEDKNIWIQIDPTWADTTGGIDYFSKMDLNHITFVIHGESSTSPLPPGFYKTSARQGKTIRVEPSNRGLEVNEKYDVNAYIPDKIRTYSKSEIKFSVVNHSGRAIYNLPVKIQTPYHVLESPVSVIDQILPWSRVAISIKVKPKNLWLETNGEIFVKIGRIENYYETKTSPAITKKPAIFIFITVISGLFGFFAVKTGKFPPGLRPKTKMS